MRWSRCGIGCSARSGKGAEHAGCVRHAAPPSGSGRTHPNARVEKRGPSDHPHWLGGRAGRGKRQPKTGLFRVFIWPRPFPNTASTFDRARRRRPPTGRSRHRATALPGRRVSAAARSDRARRAPGRCGKTAGPRRRGDRPPPRRAERRTRRARAPRHAVSISFACLRVVAVISRPPSIRATSSIRLALSSGTTVDTAPPSPSCPFATWKW